MKKTNNRPPRCPECGQPFVRDENGLWRHRQCPAAKPSSDAENGNHAFVSPTAARNQKSLNRMLEDLKARASVNEM